MRTVNPTMLCFAGLLAFHGASGQILLKSKSIEAKLTDGTVVTVMAAFDKEQTNSRYYYLPANLRISTKNDGTPEFSFLTYAREDNGEVTGGILHFLVRWGLAEKQEAELQTIVRKKTDSTGTLLGAALVTPLPSPVSWEITAQTAVGKILNRSIASSGQAPTSPGSKMAISFKFNAEDAREMKAALEKQGGAGGDKMRLLFHYRHLERTVPNGDKSVWVVETDLGKLFDQTRMK